MAVCEFVRVHFDDLLDRYYWEGHGSLNAFPAWAFERYLVGRGSRRRGSERGKYEPPLQAKRAI